MSKNNLFRFACGVLGAAVVASEFIKRARRISLRGKQVLIMGGSRGLGLEVARTCLERGANVILAARDMHELEEAQRMLDAGNRIHIFTCEATHENEVKRLINQINENLGAIDILINNEGVIETGPENFQTRRDFTNSMNTHFWAPLFAIQTVLPQMKERRSGRIVNISSIAGLLSVPHLLPYSASKHALVGLSEGFRTELMKDNIFVTTVCPGLMRTGSPRNADFKGNNKIEYAMFDLLDALPFTSIDSKKAADKIVDATERGEAQLVITLQAQLVKAIHSAAPGMVAEVFGLTNYFLPAKGGIGSNTAKGKESESPVAPSILTKLSDAAAVRNNEFAQDNNRAQG